MDTPQQSPSRPRLFGSVPRLAAFRQRLGLLAVGTVGVVALSAVATTAHASTGGPQRSGTAQVQAAPSINKATTAISASLHKADAKAAETAAAEKAAADKATADKAAADKAAAEKAAAAKAVPAAAPAPTHSSPVPGARLTAHFGDGGDNWGGGKHTGLDFAAPQGTPVKAVAAGTVVSAGWDGPYGNRVVVKHADGTSSTYNHLSRTAVSGGKVAVGQTVGYLGSTGNSTGPHLHLEILKPNGAFTDPLTWLRGNGVTV
jgi:murein DD-endopeptidase MepM/ murein hydrolase activator NlpD